jgi:hypothetical protein
MAIEQRACFLCKSEVPPGLSLSQVGLRTPGNNRRQPAAVGGRRSAEVGGGRMSAVGVCFWPLGPQKERSAQGAGHRAPGLLSAFSSQLLPAFSSQRTAVRSPIRNAQLTGISRRKGHRTKNQKRQFGLKKKKRRKALRFYVAVAGFPWLLSSDALVSLLLLTGVGLRTSGHRRRSAVPVPRPATGGGWPPAPQQLGLLAVLNADNPPVLPVVRVVRHTSHFAATATTATTLQPGAAACALPLATGA